MRQWTRGRSLGPSRTTVILPPGLLQEGFSSARRIELAVVFGIRLAPFVHDDGSILLGMEL